MTISAQMPERARLVFALQVLLRQLLANDIETPRPCKTACLLLLSGLSTNSIPAELHNRIYSEQHEDGGWVGPDDTMWALLFLRLCGRSSDVPFKKGLQYLEAVKSNKYGWGRSERDIPRIPVTGRILHFLPELCTPQHLSGLLGLWEKEECSLTYKAAFTLAACSTAGIVPDDSRLVRSAVTWLISQQNDDGGFAPWKGHPVGSDIYCTSIAVFGLASYPCEVPGQTFRDSLNWMVRTQLGNGLWPYHQIEDGASWGLYAAVLLTALMTADETFLAKLFTSSGAHE